MPYRSGRRRLDQRKARTLAAALASGALSSDPAAIDEALPVVSAVALHVRLSARRRLRSSTMCMKHLIDLGRNQQSA